MANLSRQAQRSIRKAKWFRSTELPVWWPLLQGVLAVVFVVWFVVAIGSSSSSTTAPTTPADLPGILVPDTTAPLSPPTPPPPTTPPTPGSELVELPFAAPDGTVDESRRVAVPSAALERARATAAASFVGVEISRTAVRSYEERDVAVFVFYAELSAGESSVEVSVVFRNDAWVTAG